MSLFLLLSFSSLCQHWCKLVPLGELSNFYLDEFPNPPEKGTKKQKPINQNQRRAKPYQTIPRKLPQLPQMESRNLQFSARKGQNHYFGFNLRVMENYSAA